MGFFSGKKPNNKRPNRSASPAKAPVITDAEFQRQNNILQNKIDMEKDWNKMFVHWHDRIVLVATKMGNKQISNDVASLKWVVKVFSIKVKAALGKGVQGSDEARIQYGTMMGAYIGQWYVKNMDLEWNSDKDESKSGFNTLKINDAESFDIIHASIDWCHEMEEGVLLQHIAYIDMVLG
jgi:hypothetical protein